jgi:hypothetical protein
MESGSRVPACAVSSSCPLRRWGVGVRKHASSGCLPKGRMVVGSSPVVVAAHQKPVRRLQRQRQRLVPPWWRYYGGVCARFPVRSGGLRPGGGRVLEDGCRSRRQRPAGVSRLVGKQVRHVGASICLGQARASSAYAGLSPSSGRPAPVPCLCHTATRSSTVLSVVR